MIYTHLSGLGATASRATVALNIPQISLYSGSALSLRAVIDLICRYWSGSSSTKNMLCGIAGRLTTAQGRRELCELLDNRADELQKALGHAAAQNLVAIVQKTGIIQKCAVCGGRYDAGDLIDDIVDLVTSAYSGDGIDWSGLGQAAVRRALAEAVCCAVIYGTAAAIAKLPIASAFSTLRSVCASLVQADGGTVTSSGGALTITPSGGGSGPLRTQEQLRLLLSDSSVRAALAAEAAKDVRVSAKAPAEERTSALPLVLAGVGVFGTIGFLFWRRRRRRG